MLIQYNKELTCVLDHPGDAFLANDEDEFRHELLDLHSHTQFLSFGINSN
jgi:hypothetical protein